MFSWLFPPNESGPPGGTFEVVHFGEEGRVVLMCCGVVCACGEGHWSVDCMAMTCFALRL